MRKICVCSLFRNSVSRLERFFADRASWDRNGYELRHIWVEGDSEDETWSQLCAERRRLGAGTVALARHSLGTALYTSVVHAERFQALAACANFALNVARSFRPEWVLWLESDLRTPPDLLPRLLAHRRPVVAPMVLIEGTNQFYDTWAFRAGNSPRLSGPGGAVGCFQHGPPYHPAYRSDAPFIIDSAGSALLFAGSLLEQGVHFPPEDVIVGLCRQIRQRGHAVTVDPTLHVWHPNPWQETA
jgi:hypothetical protein